METNLGGKRLGSGNKMKVSFKNFERSTHDTSFLFRSTISAGTLVPFMSELMLPGDTFDINLGCSILTHPTIGPLFGSYKVQLDVFQVPIRLYQAGLHMNMLNIGMKMNKMLLPQILIEGTNIIDETKAPDNQQINPSSIFSYLNIRGIGLDIDKGNQSVSRKFNAVPWLAYWDIYKNYYSNKQEEIGAVIHTPASGQKPTVSDISTALTTPLLSIPWETGSTTPLNAIWSYSSRIEIQLDGTIPQPLILENIWII